MMKVKEALEMEQALKENISLGFFEYGIHSEMDLMFYKAYSAIKSLRMLLEAFEMELREEAEDIKKEVEDMKQHNDRNNTLG